MTDESSQRPLANRGFISLLVTQFFGVVNDNLLKQVLTFGLAMAGVWKGALGEGGHSWVAVALVLPFLLFGAIAGQLADRYSKQLVTVRMKLADFPEEHRRGHHGHERGEEKDFLRLHAKVAQQKK